MTVSPRSQCPSVPVSTYLIFESPTVRLFAPSATVIPARTISSIFRGVPTAGTGLPWTIVSPISKMPLLLVSYSTGSPGSHTWFPLRSTIFNFGSDFNRVPGTGAGDPAIQVSPRLVVSAVPACGMVPRITYSPALNSPSLFASYTTASAESHTLLLFESTYLILELDRRLGAGPRITDSPLS